MGVPVPSTDELGAIAAGFGLSPSHDELAAYRELVAGSLAAYDAVEDLYQQQAPAIPERKSWRPEPADNPLGAWYRQCAVRERDDGPLAGRRIAIKDNVDVAGVPMMNGSATLEGFVPRSDATVVRRILVAGGEIAGKAVCEDLCFSGGSHTAATGPVRNPWDPSRSAGGSSCGSAVLVATGQVDMAIAGDQGGSVRMPAGWCGIVGIKASYGLVPYTGAFPIEYTIDNLGPIARTVDDVALLLTAIAGPDGVDDRQLQAPSGVDYTVGLDRDPADLRIAVVAEGFGHPNSDAEVDETVRAALGRLEAAGAEVRQVSIPEHLWAAAVWSVIATEGGAWQMLRGNGYGLNHRGKYNPEIMEAFRDGWRRHGNEVSHSVKYVALFGQYMLNLGGGSCYAKAQNVRPLINQAYDRALEGCDVLCYPTLPMMPTVLPAEDCSVSEYVARALEMVPNTLPCSVTGHPTINVPAGLSDGLPVGMSFVARHWNETTALAAAKTYESLVGGFPSPPAL